jgi:hypothetical protein
VNEAMYQTRMENKVQHNIPTKMVVNIKIRQVDMVHIMQTSEHRIRHNRQPINYYQEKKFGIYLLKTYINITNSQIIIVVSIDKKIVHIWIVCSLDKMFEMQ